MGRASWPVGSTLVDRRAGHIGVEAGPASSVGTSGISFFRSVRSAPAAPRLGRVITNALRSLWAEPRAADAPDRVSRDWALVAAVMVAALLEGVLRDDVAWRPIVTIVTIGLAPVLLWRRTHPLACVVAAFGTALVLGLASLVGGASSLGLNTMIFVLVFVYALVRWGSGREIVIGLTVVLVAAVVGTVADATGPGDVFGGFAVLAASAAGGAAFRYRAESWSRALDQIRSQERVGLARELHDMVAHHVSAIAVQAQAGQALVGQRPEAALEALAVIEGEASRTLTEMRAMVRVLRDGTSAEYAPQPGVADLAALARHDRAPVVDVRLPGDLGELPLQVDAAVYRLAQEALTNALRHARNASRVEIRVVEGEGRLRLRVTDDGQIDPVRPVAHGFGLLGMTERVHLLGGTLRAGPAPEGGWAVDAELPMEVGP
ncbi:sensor histidine kinase [Aeromicrobium sp. S22]|uniref:sensor histidine kinase n=1 Tax=Aeromicrobium sp. S22 TaxID=2662029 RepID=UPI00129D7972|nr:sensor histidine kinase [Aeromicrobium sp. S22]